MVSAVDTLWDVIIVGAGPVGLLLGNLLGSQGVRALMLEREPRIRARYQAIGITPPSLAVLRHLGLEKPFVENGVPVGRAVLRGSRRILGQVDFSRPRMPFPFYLAIPQYATEQWLEGNLARYPGIRLLRQAEAKGIRLENGRATVSAAQAGRRPRDHCAKLLCGCDGKNSLVRQSLGIPFPGGRYRTAYLMGEYLDRGGLGQDAFFFFTPRGPVESFPLPGQERRWVAATDHFMREPPAGFLENLIWERTGIRLSRADRRMQSAFGTEHYLAGIHDHHRVYLAGDALHLMSPIGGLGMNAGFGDARLCSRMIGNILAGGDPAACAGAYQAQRRRAARRATRQDHFLMWLETRRGRTWSGLRNGLTWAALRVFPETMARRFAGMGL